MNPFRIPREDEFHKELSDAGFTKTDQTLGTGTFWVSTTGKHLLVTEPYQGMYPEAIAKPLRDRFAVLNRKLLE